MNVFTYFDRTSARCFAIIALLALILTTLFAPFYSTQAASTGLSLNKSTLTINAGERGNFVATASSDDATYTADTYIAVSDGSGGGSFHNGTVDGDCNSAAVDGDNEFAIGENKGVCYSNATPGDYTITVQLYDSLASPIGSPQTLSVTVNADPNDVKKVQYCHATESLTNPFTFIDTSVNALLNAGHDEHAADIIPAFNDFLAKNLDSVYQTYGGMTGQQILDAECPAVPAENEETTDEVYGCTNQSATNYNPKATIDDQSCQFEDDDEEVPQCVDNEKDWADSVHWSFQGNKKDGSPITDVNRTNPDAATGEADWSDGESTGFFSLGFGGSIKVAFDNYVIDTEGVDISIHEATNGRYPLEKAEVWVSQNGDDWFMIGYADNTSGDRVTYLDFSSSGLNWISFVKVVDVSNPDLHDATADGFDLDAVDATESVCDEPEEPEPTGKCEIEGHKYDAEGNPLEGWTIGLMKVATDGENTNVYDILSDVTDKDGYYCLEWGDNPSFTLRGEDNIEGEYTSFAYRIFEVLKDGWKNIRIEMGATVPELAAVDEEDVDTDGEYISTQFGEENGYIIAEAAYHTDFYNEQLDSEGEDITVCKYEVPEENVEAEPVAVPGWSMLITNDKEGEGNVSYELETGENGCVTQEVDPELGPWYVYENLPENWAQVDVDAYSGYVQGDDEDEEMYCRFGYKYYIDEYESEYLNQLVVLDEERQDWRCNFYNTELATPNDDDTPNGGNGRKVELDDDPEERVDGDSDSQDEAPGKVLGEQTSIIPAGAPNTGAGGTASSHSVFALMHLIYAGRRK